MKGIFPTYRLVLVDEGLEIEDSVEEEPHKKKTLSLRGKWKRKQAKTHEEKDCGSGSGSYKTCLVGHYLRECFMSSRIRHQKADTGLAQQIKRL
jgi:hypothetical protein